MGGGDQRSEGGSVRVRYAMCGWVGGRGGSGGVAEGMCLSSGSEILSEPMPQ